MKSLRVHYECFYYNLQKNRHNIVYQFLEVLHDFLSWIFDVYYKIILVKNGRNINKLPCLIPFLRLEFGSEGNVTPCCSAFSKVQSVGNISTKNIEEIWNSKRMQRFRRFLYLGKTNKTCNADCPFLFDAISIHSLHTTSDHLRLLSDDIKNKRTELSAHPYWFGLSNWGKCNINCIMCHRTKELTMPQHVHRTMMEIKNYYDKEIEIFATGNGDPFIRNDSFDLLSNFQTTLYPKVKFEILTNGTLLTLETFQKIKHLKYTWINISVDAATKETYEKIRRGAKWEKIIDNLNIVKRAKESGVFPYVAINMTVMRSNYKEISSFVRLSRDFGFASYFSVIRGAWGNENIFEMDDSVALEELREILSDEKLYGDDVDFVQLRKYVPVQYQNCFQNIVVQRMYKGKIKQ